jgi:hypothetical protein
VPDTAARAFRDGRWSVERARERVEQEVVVLTVAHVEAKAVRVHAGDDPGAEQRGRERVGLLDRDEEEVRRRGKGLEPERAERPRATLALLDLPADVGWVGEAGEGQRRREVRDRLRRLAAVELGGRLPVGERISDASAREPERLRERSQDDDAVVDKPGSRDAGVLEVRLVDDERARSGEIAELPGRCSGGSRTSHRTVAPTSAPGAGSRSVEQSPPRSRRRPRAGERARREVRSSAPAPSTTFSG